MGEKTPCKTGDIMSFCRWSTDNFQCDLYVYATISGGYMVHVADHKRIFTEPFPEPVDRVGTDAWWKRHQKVTEMVDNARIVKIGLPCDGKTFHESNAEDAAELVQSLINMGYRAPAYVVDNLREEDDKEGK